MTRGLELKGVLRIARSLRANMARTSSHLARAAQAAASRHWETVPFSSYPLSVQAWFLQSHDGYLTLAELNRLTGSTDLSAFASSLRRSTRPRNAVTRISLLSWLAFALGTEDELPGVIASLIDGAALRPRTVRLAIEAAASVMHVTGQFHVAEAIEISGKYQLDQRMDRRPGLRYETLYLSAIGHLALLDLLFKAIRLGLIDANDVHLVEAEGRTANEIYAQLWRSQAKDLGVEIESRRGAKRLWVEPDIETWPMKSHGYAIARHQYGRVLSLWGEQQLSTQLRLSAEQLSSARQVLTDLGLREERWFAGLHLRSGRDPLRLLRNTPLGMLGPTIAEVASRGGTCILVGDFPGEVPEELQAISIDIRGLSGYVRDLVHNYVWSKSRIFIGNLSGGTFPPSTFGVPTLWADIYPIAHMRPPNARDMMVPKLTYSEHLGRLLTLRECVSRDHSRSQVESPDLLADAGYRVRPCAPEEIARATRDLLDSLTPNHEQGHRLDERVDSAFQARGLGRGARVAPSFLDAWGSELV